VWLTCRCGNKAAIVDIDEDMNHKIIQVGVARLLFQLPVWQKRRLCWAQVLAIMQVLACMCSLLGSGTTHKFGESALAAGMYVLL
jgi:hypothetical protein